MTCQLASVFTTSLAILTSTNDHNSGPDSDSNSVSDSDSNSNRPFPPRQKALTLLHEQLSEHLLAPPSPFTTPPNLIQKVLFLLSSSTPSSLLPSLLNSLLLLLPLLDGTDPQTLDSMLSIVHHVPQLVFKYVQYVQSSSPPSPVDVTKQVYDSFSTLLLNASTSTTSLLIPILGTLSSLPPRERSRSRSRGRSLKDDKSSTSEEDYPDSKAHDFLNLSLESLPLVEVSDVPTVLHFVLKESSEILNNNSNNNSNPSTSTLLTKIVKSIRTSPTSSTDPSAYLPLLTSSTLSSTLLATPLLSDALLSSMLEGVELITVLDVIILTTLYAGMGVGQGNATSKKIEQFLTDAAAQQPSTTLNRVIEGE